jgi:diguanylate cyclase (GGDEF)-like protein
MLSGMLAALAGATGQLAAMRRENQELRQRNEQLLKALAAASRRGVEAYRVARRDGLTGLPNRLLFKERLQEEIALAVLQQRQFALLFIDLDGFKQVNDRFGHLVGDKLLAAAAARLAVGVRAEDIACRYGGDEFVVLLSHIGDENQAHAVANKIAERVSERYAIDGQELSISASIGVALYPIDGLHCDALLQSADASMYRNKLARSHDSNNNDGPTQWAQTNLPIAAAYGGGVGGTSQLQYRLDSTRC